MKRALISVFDKEGIVPFAKRLSELGVEIVSTGGTFKLLQKEGVPVIAVDDLTQFPEMMDGRVKTLHPMVHGGILNIRKDKAHQKSMKDHDIKAIDLVVVNLYPFLEVIKKKNVAFETAIENIDIGGPTMLRSAAKNFQDVTVVCDKEDYALVLDELEESGNTEWTTRLMLAQKVFALTNRYDFAIQNYLLEKIEGKKRTDLPHNIEFNFQKTKILRYGENPHQKAAWYAAPGVKEGFTQLHGKELSFNNMLDMTACIDILKEFSEPTVTVVKHHNPCGICSHNKISEAIKGAVDSDPLSAFGGIVGINEKCTEEDAKVLMSKLSFFEIVLAPQFDRGAVKVFESKKNLRVIKISKKMLQPSKKFHFIPLDNGMLVQEKDKPVKAEEKKLIKSLKSVTKKKATPKDIDELLFAWKCCKVVKSNAIVITKNKKTIGIGAGQMSRVGSMEIACRQAGKEAEKAYIASDAFFPMPDNISVAAKYKARAIIQPGGSIKDPDVIEACDKKGVIMVMTGKRHFKH